MASPVRIWLEISHHAAFRIGGWAWIRAGGPEVVGKAGGDRRIDAERATLAALLAALDGVARPIRLHTSAASIAALPARIAKAEAGEEVPAENLDLWAAATKALVGVEIVRAAAAPNTPSAFAAGWAEFAREKAKLGPFSWAIPKPNLAKAGV